MIADGLLSSSGTSDHRNGSPMDSDRYGSSPHMFGHIVIVLMERLHSSQEELWFLAGATAVPSAEMSPVYVL